MSGAPKYRPVHGAHGGHAVDAVASALRQLGPGFHVMHDVPIGPGTIDHIVVSVGGVYTITTNRHAGAVTGAGGELRLSGRVPDKDPVRQAYDDAMAVRNHLRALRGADVAVLPLLVFTNAYVQVNGPVAGVRVLPVKWLAEALVSAPQRLSESTSVNIAATLKTAPGRANGSGGGRRSTSGGRQGGSGLKGVITRVVGAALA